MVWLLFCPLDPTEPQWLDLLVNMADVLPLLCCCIFPILSPVVVMSHVYLSQ